MAYRELMGRMVDGSRQLGRDIPDVMRAFRDLHRTSMAPGALDAKVKELIALGIAVCARCKACIGFHVQAALKAGASRAEIEEALGVAVLMGGGPSVMYASEALEALDELTAETPEHV